MLIPVRFYYHNTSAGFWCVTLVKLILGPVIEKNEPQYLSVLTSSLKSEKDAFKKKTIHKKVNSTFKQFVQSFQCEGRGQRRAREGSAMYLFTKVGTEERFGTFHWARPG